MKVPSCAPVLICISCCLLVKAPNWCVGEKERVDLARGSSVSFANSSQRSSAVTSSSRNGFLSYLRKCHWNCNKKQEPEASMSWVEKSIERIKLLNTTCLLLFTTAGGDDRYESVLTVRSTLGELRETNFRPAGETVLLIHGFRSHFSGGHSWVIRLKELIVSRARFANVLFVDWSNFSRTFNYLSAKSRMKLVAEDTVEVLQNLQTAFGSNKLNLTDLHLVGHSLGAHISGLVARLLAQESPSSSKVRQITALDPTDVYMGDDPDEDKLTADDAYYVMAYHTDVNLGTEKGLADRDIFFNGGNWQPTCWATTKAFRKPGCSHRAATYYASAYMDRCMMVGYICTNYKTFLDGECGFCRRSSKACVTAGLEWQYAPAARSSLVPEDRGEKRLTRSWVHLNESQRYYVDVGASDPYCLFTYQVVMKLELEQQIKLEPIKLELWLAESSQSVQVELKARPSERYAPLEVFLGDGLKTRLVGGSNVLTGLLKINSESRPDVYARLPARFRTARPLSNGPSPISAQVYANLMSHSSYQERARHSGPLELVG